MSARFTPCLLLTILSTPVVALAHPGHVAESGLWAGVLHPLLGLDHQLAMVGVGLWAARQSDGRGARRLAGLFLVVLALGFLAGLAVTPGLWIETGVLASVVLIGVLLTVGRTLPARSGLPLAALLAVSHGLAHGADMGAGLSAPLFGTGFLLASSALVGSGLFLGHLARMLPAGRGLVRAGGLAILVAGLVMAWVA